MKLVHLLYVITGMLLLLNVSLNIESRRTSKELNDALFEAKERDKYIHRVERGVTAFYKINLKRQEKDHVLSNEALKYQLEEGDKVICYMRQGVCTACIFRILQDLSIMEEKIGKGHVVVATNIGVKDHPFEIQGFDFPTVYVDTLFFAKEVIKEPIVFVADKYMNIKLFYLPELFPEMRQRYFAEFLPNYFKDDENMQLLSN